MMIEVLVIVILATILMWSFIKSKPAEPTAEDVYRKRNEPYGYWKAGNPIVKIMPVIVILVGVFAKETSLTLQGTAVLFIMLWAPFSPNTKFKNIVLNFGLGSLALSMLVSSKIPYNLLERAIEIPYWGPVELVSVANVFIMSLAYACVAPAVTSRDLAWLMDMVPVTRCRKSFAKYVYSYVYGLFRCLNLVWDVDTSIRSRGVDRPYAIFSIRSLNAFENTSGLWLLNFYRRFKEMKLIIAYVIISRIRISKRGVPVWLNWSPTDLTIGGLLVIGVFIPRIVQL